MQLPNLPVFSQLTFYTVQYYGVCGHADLIYCTAGYEYKGKIFLKGNVLWSEHHKEY